VYSRKVFNPRYIPDCAPTLPELAMHRACQHLACKKNGAEIGAVKEGVVQKTLTTLEECLKQLPTYCHL
jgi:hypothetical protein